MVIPSSTYLLKYSSCISAVTTMFGILYFSAGVWIVPAFKHLLPFSSLPTDHVFAIYK